MKSVAITIIFNTDSALVSRRSKIAECPPGNRHYGNYVDIHMSKAKCFMLKKWVHSVLHRPAPAAQGHHAQLSGGAGAEVNALARRAPQPATGR
jgi:hypothetical protein